MQVLMKNFRQLSVAKVVLFNVVVSVVCFTPAIVPSKQVFGQANPNTAVVTNEDSPLGSTPTIDFQAELDLKAGGRVITIHREAARPNRVRNIYFHRPVFAFIEKNPPLDGYPSVVQEVTPDTSGNTYLRFTIQSSSPEIRSLCRARVLESDLDLRSDNEVAMDTIRVERWPILRAIIDCRVRSTLELLSQGVSSQLVTSGEQWDFVMPFSSSNLRRMLDILSKNPGGIQFEFKYTFQNRTVESARRTAIASQTLSQVVARALDAQQLDQDGPIFQNQVNEILRNVESAAEWRTVTDSSAVLALLRTDLAPKIMEPLTLEQLEKENPDQAKELAKYLTPQIETIAKKFEQNNAEKLKSVEVTNDVTKLVTKTNVGGGFGLDFKFIKFDLKGGGDQETTRSLSRDLSKEVERSLGLKGSYDYTTQSYKASNIKIFKYNKGTEASTSQIIDRVFLITGSSTGYFPDSPVAANFTANEVLRQGEVQQKKELYGGIRLGMIVPYFGEKLPEGYEWADGEAKWPNESWVPAKLKGKNVPNLNGRVLRGLAGEEILGYEGGSDKVPGHKTVNDGSHRHTFNDPNRPLSGLTAGAYLNPQPTNMGGRFSVHNPFGADRQGEDFLVTEGDNGRNEHNRGKGQHRHVLDGNGIANSAGAIATNVSEGQHEHVINDVNYIPSYISTRYIIRMR